MRLIRYVIAPAILVLALLAAGPSVAEEEEERPDPDGAALEPLLSEDPQGSGRPPWEADPDDPQGCTDDEIGVLRDLRGRSARLDSRARNLDAREGAVKRLEDHAAEQVTRLERMRIKLLALVAQRSEARLQRVEELAKMVSNMKPRAAAPLLAGLEEETAVLVLKALKSKQAGKVLSAMTGPEALRLGERYTAMPDPRPDGDGPADAEGDEE
jgi:flagellar motility protein MotE (MotC chaperone)